MALHPNSLLLKNTLEALPELDNRYQQIQLMNLPAGGQKVGCFSLVFRAWDKVDERWVALKFYDVDPSVLTQQYRVACFHREHEILQQIFGAERCLQLASTLRQYNLIVQISPTQSITLPCSYFAVDWIPDQIDKYFLNQGANDALTKLQLFNEIVLAVEALHNREVFHRDLKADNLRACERELKRIVVAIDLGTAARFESPGLAIAYGGNVGAPGYASPEAISGLAGVRSIAKFTDVYALGCLLFELFHKDLFYFATRHRNAGLDGRIGAMQQAVLNAKNDADRVTAWNRSLQVLGAGVVAPSVDSPGGSCPRGIADLVDGAISGLTAFDYRSRSTLSAIRLKLASAILALKNDRAYKSRLESRQALRRARIHKQEMKDQRLAAMKKGLKS